MPESSQPPHPPVSTVARLLATVALLHGSALAGSGGSGSSASGRSGIDRDTATAVIDAVAYLTSTGDTDGADALMRLVTTDPDTIAAAHVALHVPARRPDSTAPTGEPPPTPAPLPRRIPRPYRDPGEPDLPARSDARARATGLNPAPTTNDLEPPLTATTGRGGADGSNGSEELPLAETRRWRDATAAQVLLLDYALPDAEGQLTGVYTPVPIVHPPGWCDHLDTICGGCLTGWSEDHAVALFRHGINGATTGCRCPLCRTTIPDRSSAHDPRTTDHPSGDRTERDTRDRDTSWFGEGS